MKLKKDDLRKIIAGFSFSGFFIILVLFGYSREAESNQASVELDFEVATIEDSIKSDLSVRDSLELFGKAFLGVPYVYGGTSESGFDCSGFVYYVYNEFGFKVPRSSSLFANFGKDVPIDSVKKGDILVFLSPTRNAIGHVGIVTNPKGMESEFIHASSSKEMKVMISNLKQPSYTRRFVKAISVLEN
jgi:cell wall-associated NlpC family hydrolase